MPLRKSKQKNQTGSIRIKNSNGRLQLVFSHPVVNSDGDIINKRFYHSVGYDDTPMGRQQAAVLAAIIQRDIEYGEFDATLAKYKPTVCVDSIPVIHTPEKKLDLLLLWEKYIEFKKPQVSQSTYAIDYRKYGNHIAKLPSKDLEDAVAIRNYLIANLSPNSAKRTLTNINACCNWAVKSQLIETNPFNGMAKEVQIPKSDRYHNDINPFTRKERDAVIQAFEESKLYSYYAPLVKFLFFTGCRPSEAIALQWKHIGEKFITFEQAVALSDTGISVKRGLKTQSHRRFPINNQLQNILDSVRPENHRLDEFIFKSKQGAIIKLGNFLNHAWRGYKNRHGSHIDGIVTILAKKGIISQYRKPYQCRHTFITLCLDEDIDAKDVAKWVGNSPEVIYKHYAGSNHKLQVPLL